MAPRAMKWRREGSSDLLEREKLLELVMRLRGRDDELEDL